MPISWGVGPGAQNVRSATPFPRGERRALNLHFCFCRTRPAASTPRRRLVGVSHPKPMATIFERIIAREIPARIVHEDDL